MPQITPGQPEPSAHESSELNDDMSILNGDDTPPQEETPEETVDEEESPEESTTDTDDAEEESPEEDGEDEEEVAEEEEETPEPEADPAAQMHARPTVKQIKGKYPDFFKDFPEMRHMLFREQEYTGIFPTVEEAKTASSQSKEFETFSNLLQSGKREDFNEFLKGVSEAGPDTLTSMAANFLPSVYNTNRDLYFQVTTPIAQGLLQNAYKAAKAAGNTNLENAALHIALWALGDAKYATGEMKLPALQAKEEVKDPKLESERAAFYAEKYSDARTFVSTSANKQLSKEIKRGLDPNNVFNEFTNQLLLKTIMEELGTKLESDSEHITRMNGLWNQAAKAGFVGTWKDRLLSTYLSRARTYLPAIRTKIREEALKGAKSRTARVEEIASRSANRRDVQGSQNASPKRQAPGAFQPGRKVNWDKTSDLDVLNDKVTYK